MKKLTYLVTGAAGFLGSHVCRGLLNRGERVLDAVKEKGLNASVVFPSGIMGPDDYGVGETTGTVIRIIKGEMPVGIDGSFNLADARDLAQGVILAADKGAQGGCYILGNEVVTFRDFSRIIAQASGGQPMENFLPIDRACAMAEAMEKEAEAKGTKPDPLFRLQPGPEQFL